ncbi:MAG TPA: acyl carrier protein [Thermoanaerobaculia bacterium]|nr:acyl carrier protein [Thermoanaerobaculia bacterium]
MEETFRKLAAILSDVLKVPPEKIQRESLLFEDLKADSLDASLIVMEIEEHFDLTVPERSRTYRTVADLLLHVDELLREKAAGTSAKPEPAA